MAKFVKANATVKGGITETFINMDLVFEMHAIQDENTGQQVTRICYAIPSHNDKTDFLITFVKETPEELLELAGRLKIN